MACRSTPPRRTAPAAGKSASGSPPRLIVHWGDSLHAISGDLRRPLPDTSALVVGMRDRPGATAHSGSLHGIHLRLTPLGAYRLLGVPMSELRGAAVDLTDLLGRSVRHLAPRLAEETDWPSRFTLLSRTLTARMDTNPQPDPTVERAWRRLCASRGRIGVAELATELGASRRHLTRRFHHQIGLAPKTLARILRFRHALSLRRDTEALTWSQIAAACGYHDQAHLNADFRDLAGCSPTEFTASRR